MIIWFNVYLPQWDRRGRTNQVRHRSSGCALDIGDS